MASAELLKMTHSVEGNMQGVRDDMQDVGNMVQSAEGRVRGDVQRVDDKLDLANSSLSLYSLVIIPSAQTGITGNQLRDNLLRWLSPPDSSTNHNIASKAHHNGTAEWFFRGSIFNQWRTTGSFLWIHGKRAFPLAFTMHQPLIFTFL
jgi:hypothetical protein